MRKFLTLVAFALALFTGGDSRLRAQMSQQNGIAQSANTFTSNNYSFTVPGAFSLSDLLWVPIRIIPSATNTGAVTVTPCSGCATTAVMKLANTGLSALSNGEMRQGQLTELVYDGTEFILWPQLGQYVHASDFATSALAHGDIINMDLTASVAANALTISVLTNGGATPTATTPVTMLFRNTTVGGVPLVGQITAAAQIVISSGNTMGCVSGQSCHIWVVGAYNAGTVQICAITPLSGTNIGPINEVLTQSSASGTTGGSSAQTYYCNASSLSGVPIRILGYVEIQEATAGTWATGPTIVQAMGPGIAKPGQLVNELSTNGASASQAITPQSAADLMEVTGSFYVPGSSGGVGGWSITGDLKRGATILGTQTNAANASASSQACGSGFTIPWFDLPNTTSPVTYSVTATGVNCAGSVNNTQVIVKELQTMLEPANDNGLPLSKVG
jgi:hypothetical protein